MQRSVSRKADELFGTVISFFYPRHCPVCDGVLNAIEYKDGHLCSGRLIHDECDKKVKRIRGNTCRRCGKPLAQIEADNEYCGDCKHLRHRFDRGFAVFDYRSISGSVYRFKYQGRQEYAEYYAKEAVKIYGSRLKKLGIEAIIPVPMYKGKVIKRGYNQAEILAREISKELGIPIFADVIARSRDTLPMKKLDSRGRRNNLKKAFNICRNDVKFKCILIIDDIYTTGSTIDEITHEFQVAGVKRTYFLTLSIGQTT